MTLLTAHQLGQQRSQKTLLHNISLTLHAGEIVAVVGPNGAGKSTLLHSLAGILPITQGSLTIGAQSVQGWQARDWAQAISFLPQLSAVPFSLTVLEVVQLGGFAAGLAGQRLQAASTQALEHWQLSAFANANMQQLSGGEQQRVQLARTWLQLQAPSCQLWLLDEPFSALDLGYQQQCLAHIQSMQKQGKSIVMVVHDLNFARQCADRVLLLQQGEMVAFGSAKEVLNAQQVSEVFASATRLENGQLVWW